MPETEDAEVHQLKTPEERYLEAGNSLLGLLHPYSAQVANPGLVILDYRAANAYREFLMEYADAVEQFRRRAIVIQTSGGVVSDESVVQDMEALLGNLMSRLPKAESAAEYAESA